MTMIVDAERRIAADLSRRLAESERLAGRLREELAAIEALPAALLREAFAQEANMPDVWSPTVVQRVISVSRTSTQVAIVETDAGRGYLKAIGNPAGEHALAREWVGTELAQAMGLLALDHAIINYDGTPLIRFHPPKNAAEGLLGALAKAGPAYITRAEKLSTLEAGKVTLDRVQNAGDFAKLVVFDTWTINPDRYFPDETIRHPNRKNVAFSRTGRIKWLLRAIDQTHCITREPHLSVRVREIVHWQDNKVYGLFPEFRPFMRAEYIQSAVESLDAITQEQIEQAVAGIPPEWQVDPEVRQAVVGFLWTRKGYVVDNITQAIADAMAQPLVQSGEGKPEAEQPGGAGQTGEME